MPAVMYEALGETLYIFGGYHILDFSVVSSLLAVNTTLLVTSDDTATAVSTVRSPPDACTLPLLDAPQAHPTPCMLCSPRQISAATCGSTAGGEQPAHGGMSFGTAVGARLVIYTQDVVRGGCVAPHKPIHRSNT